MRGSTGNGANILRPSNDDGVTHLCGEMRGEKKAQGSDKYMFWKVMG